MSDDKAEVAASVTSVLARDLGPVPESVGTGKLCKCGCGYSVRLPEHSYIWGHNGRAQCKGGRDASLRRYYSSHRNEVQERNRTWKNQNWQRYRDWAREYHRQNRQLWVTSKKRWESQWRQKALEAFGNECYVCGKTTSRMALHHITYPDGKPKGYYQRWKEARANPDNFRLLCPHCHATITTVLDPSKRERFLSLVNASLYATNRPKYPTETGEAYDVDIQSDVQSLPWSSVSPLSRLVWYAGTRGLRVDDSESGDSYEAEAEALLSEQER